MTNWISCWRGQFFALPSRCLFSYHLFIRKLLDNYENEEGSVAMVVQRCPNNMLTMLKCIVAALLVSARKKNPIHNAF